MNYKFISFVACSLLLAGCSTNTADKKYEKGEYQATAAGRNGDVTLTVKFSDSKIESITSEHQETPGIGDNAIKTLTDEVLQSQKVPSDVVSGATLSSNAFLTALKDAITQAGGTAEISSESKGKEVSYETEADIIVVGGGAAGMSAAVTASENGASVILLEKSAALGGNTLAAANGINAADAKVQKDSKEYQDVDASVEGLVELQSQNSNARAELVDVFAKNSGEVIDWLSAMGVAFEVDIQEDPRNPVQNYYMLKADAEGSTAATLVGALKTTLADSKVTVYTDVDVTDLVTDDNNTVTGVTATGADGKEVTFSSQAVILATGGFGQNQELVGEVNPDLKNAITDEIAPTTGEGLLMAQKIGAKAVDLKEIQTFPSVIDGSGMFMSFPLWMSGDAIAVNKEGERFAKEQFEMPSEILAQTDGLVYGIFDQDNYNDSYSGLIGNGFMVEADSLDKLAEKLGIDADALNKTVETWNADAEKNGTDSVFGRENTTAIDGKYYGYQYGVGAHYFMGGLLINADTQVLDKNEEPIAGLYAAGEVTGGFHGTQRIDGSGLGDSFVFGRVSGRVVSESIKK